MKRILSILAAVALLVPAAAFAGGLEVFLSNVNVQARADMPGFSVGLSTQFGVPVTEVQAVLRTVHEPADAFMVLQLGQMAHRPPETVLAVYQPNRKKGWGAIAKDLGIKPGSAEFHALKSGDLHFTGRNAGRGGDRGEAGGSERGNGGGKGHGGGNGHGGGHGKGHNKS